MRFLSVHTLFAAVALVTFDGKSHAAPVYHQVHAGLLKVDQVGTADDNVAEISLQKGVGNFRSIGGNRADYTVAVGPGMLASQDTETGVLMTSVAQNGRNNFGTNAYPTSCWELNANGIYRIITSLAQSGGAGNDIEYNVNVAAGWFPFASWLGGVGYNVAGANGGVTDGFRGSPGLQLGTHLVSLGGGQYVVDLRGLGFDSRYDGILLATHAKEEGNFALTQVNSANGTWNVFIRDNAQTSAGTYEQDPVSFVFIPKTNTMVVSGRFLADGTAQMFSGAAPGFSVSVLGQGRWLLKVNDGSPTNGVLIITPEGGRTINRDNIVNYQPTAAGDGWEIESRDTPNNILETPTSEPVASFVYIPGETPGFTIAPQTGLVVSAGGGTDQFSVRLDSRPSTNVTISISASNPSWASVYPTSLTFKPGTWNEPQIVTVSGGGYVGQVSAPFNIVLSPAVSGDSAYSGLNPPDVAAVVLPRSEAVISPPGNNTTTAISPLLRVAVTNHANPEGMIVKFYGKRAYAPNPGEDFTIAVLPDTQMYTGQLAGGKKEMFIAQTEWIIQNRVARNIQYVTQLGDISNNGDTPSYISQWYNATNAMYRLENPVRTQLADGMPYGVAVGNHEMTPIGTPTGSTSNYNRFFGVDRFLGRNYYAGHYGTNNNNHYDFFSASGFDFVVIYFEYDPNPPPGLLAWANDILRNNPNRRAIIVSHNMGNTQTPVAVSTQWTAIYNALKTNANMFLMLGGHVTGQGARVDTHNGNVVHTFVQDYQGWANGGDGYMRLYEFSPSNNVVVVQTFSPWLDKWLIDEESEFYFPYRMQPESAGSPTDPYAEIGTNAPVSSGSLAQMIWPGLEPNRKYEWYVTVTDASGTTTTSPVWSFTTTTTNSAPVVANTLVTITGDTSARITISAFDPNSDPYIVQIPMLPARGWISDFDPASGSATYTPARGFRGSDRLSFSASDGSLTSATATMNLNVVGPLDSDANGLPDAWEATYNVNDPQGDPDGDGQSSLSEYLANTNPTNANSVLRIVSAVPLTNGFFGISWPSIGGNRYRVQYSNGQGIDSPFIDLPRDLVSEMDTNPAGAESTRIFVDDLSLTGPATNNARYYRVRLNP